MLDHHRLSQRRGQPLGQHSADKIEQVITIGVCRQIEVLDLAAPGHLAAAAPLGGQPDAEPFIVPAGVDIDFVARYRSVDGVHRIAVVLPE